MENPFEPVAVSAEWCQKAVKVCWEAKQNNIRPAEREAAKLAYEQAEAIYVKIREEAPK